MKFKAKSLTRAEGGVRGANSASRITHHASRITSLSVRGFTMIEIAISLAIIGFALVAIIGILPTGMETQKKNRQETVINQDATVFLDAIRGGAQGLDDLTNYVVAITNYWAVYLGRASVPTSRGQNWYTYSASSTPLLLNNGLHIVGLLSTPKIIPLSPGKGGWNYMSNHVVAYVRSMSGPAAEKTPASYTPGVNPVQDMTFNLGFNYRMVSDVIPYFGYDTNGLPLTGIRPSNPVDLPQGVPTLPPVGAGRDYARWSSNLQTNQHDLRLTFLWPLLANGSAGSGFQVFRAAASGPLTWTNEFQPPNVGSWPAPLNPAYLPTTLFFFQPRTYLQVHTP